jgi:tRNA (guanosine-2'-O-)-methyltransferase
MSCYYYKNRRYSSRAVIESLSIYASETRLNRFQDILARRLTSVLLGIEDLHHEHNGAACLRTAEGLGVSKVMAAEVRNSYPMGKIPMGISKASHQWIELDTYKSGQAMIKAARSQGYKIYGAGPRGRLTLADIPCEEPLMILFGNEGVGLSEETIQSCDEVFRIPMYGFTESFNVSVSVGMALEHVCSKVRHRLHTQDRTGELNEEQKETILAQWIARDMNDLDLLLKHHLGEGELI